MENHSTIQEPVVKAIQLLVAPQYPEPATITGGWDESIEVIHADGN